MTGEQFDALARIMGMHADSAAHAGLRLVLVDGLSSYAAAARAGVARQVIDRRLARARRVIEDARELSTIS